MAHHREAETRRASDFGWLYPPSAPVSSRFPVGGLAANPMEIRGASEYASLIARLPHRQLTHPPIRLGV